MVESVFEIRRRRNPVTRRWRYWVVLLAAGNSEPLSSSEMLSSESAAMNNIEAQKAAVPGAGVDRAW